MKKTSDSWPDLLTNHVSDIAKLKNPPTVVHSLVSLTNDNDQSLNLDAIFEIRRYSIKLKLLRVTGTMLKFITLQ